MFAFLIIGLALFQAILVTPNDQPDKAVTLDDRADGEGASGASGQDVQ